MKLVARAQDLVVVIRAVVTGQLVRELADDMAVVSYGDDHDAGESSGLVRAYETRVFGRMGRPRGLGGSG